MSAHVEGSTARERRDAKHWKAPDGVMTSRGFVRHLLYKGMRCPVKLVSLRTERGALLATCPDGNPHPMVRNGVLVYALPGGYSITRDIARALANG